MLRRFYSSATPKIYGSMLLQRNPIIFEEQSPFEEAYQKYREDLECEFSKGVFHIQSETGKKNEDSTASSNVNRAEFENDEKSLGRELSRKLYLIVKEKNAAIWTLPRCLNDESAPLHKTAQKALENVVGTSAKMYFVGNAPVAYSDAHGDGIHDFIFRSQIIRGDLKINSALIEDYKWATKEELERFLPSKSYNHISRVTSV